MAVGGLHARQQLCPERSGLLTASGLSEKQKKEMMFKLKELEFFPEKNIAA